MEIMWIFLLSFASRIILQFEISSSRNYQISLFEPVAQVRAYRLVSAYYQEICQPVVYQIQFGRVKDRIDAHT